MGVRGSGVPIARFVLLTAPGPPAVELAPAR
jgi:hypothetical protein